MLLPLHLPTHLLPCLCGLCLPSCYHGRNIYLCSYLRPSAYLWIRFHSFLPPPGHYSIFPLCLLLHQHTNKLKYLPSLGKKPTFNSVSSSSNHSIYLCVPYSTHIQSPATLSHKLLKRFYVNTSNSSPPIPAFLNPFQLNFHLHLPPHHTKTTQKGTLLFGGPQK